MQFSEAGGIPVQRPSQASSLQRACRSQRCRSSHSPITKAAAGVSVLSVSEETTLTPLLCSGRPRHHYPGQAPCEIKRQVCAQESCPFPPRFPHHRYGASDQPWQWVKSGSVLFLEQKATPILVIPKGRTVLPFRVNRSISPTAPRHLLSTPLQATLHCRLT